MFSFEHSKHLKQDVLRGLQGCLRDVCLKFQGSYKGCFKEVLRVLTESFKGVSRKFQECSKEVFRVFPGIFREILRVFQQSFKGIQVRSIKGRRPNYLLALGQPGRRRACLSFV